MLRGDDQEPPRRRILQQVRAGIDALVDATRGRTTNTLLARCMPPIAPEQSDRPNIEVANLSVNDPPQTDHSQLGRTTRWQDDRDVR